ncbi:Hypothetical_protein [Hexamita inflata]|uniref:Hypothetical_protein n=1 Tax=Hexamita inflata TaxID=28002 RepID=A0ABP1HAK9_9EUKA
MIGMARTSTRHLDRKSAAIPQKCRVRRRQIPVQISLHEAAALRPWMLVPEALVALAAEVRLTYTGVSKTNDHSRERKLSEWDIQQWLFGPNLRLFAEYYSEYFHKRLRFEDFFVNFNLLYIFLTRSCCRLLRASPIHIA